PKRGPIINFRSEGRRFPKGRCLIPASHFFEFAGAKPPKSKWKFTKTGEDWFCFAGLWRPMPDGAGDAFTLLTTGPGPDVAPIHDRQMVVLNRSEWLAWLELTRPESELLRPPPAGSLTGASPIIGVVQSPRRNGRRFRRAARWDAGPTCEAVGERHRLGQLGRHLGDGVNVAARLE